ncbi:TraR/DksA C4-type zinc finger protein [Ectothiorhodospiraceae bacterium 2226]|nr:TraR/DksA C4-type zinc finger protein [Ectothiorhodospiraceae bacterium 2226]
MTETYDVAHYRRLLGQARAELLSVQEAREASTATVHLDQQSVGRLSRMDALQMQAVAQDTRRRAELALRRIEAALRRCDEGSYGYCVSCEEPIDPRRLALDPAAPLCIACAEARDA